MWKFKTIDVPKFGKHIVGLNSSKYPVSFTLFLSLPPFCTLLYINVVAFLQIFL